MYSRNLDLFLSGCPDVVIPGEFRNLQVNLKNEGCVHNYGAFEQYFVLRAHVFAHRFPCARVFAQAFVFLISGCERLYIDANIF